MFYAGFCCPITKGLLSFFGRYIFCDEAVGQITGILRLLGLSQRAKNKNSVKDNAHKLL